MKFDKDGTVSLPGFNTFRASANWRLDKKSIIVFIPDSEEKLNSRGPSKLIELENK